MYMEPQGVPEPVCPQCHTVVRATDYFCFNCGKNLHQKPLPSTPLYEIGAYLGSAVLPPLGAVWGLKYIRQPDAASKRIGWGSIVVTVIATFLVTVWMVKFAENIQTQVNQGVNQLQGF